MAYKFDDPKDMTETHLCRTVAYDKNESITESRKEKCRLELIRRWTKQTSNSKTTKVNNSEPLSASEIAANFISEQSNI